MSNYFGRYDKQNDDGTWSRLENLELLKTGSTVRVNEGAPFKVSTIKTEGTRVSFIANTMDPHKAETITLMHMGGVDGEFPPQKYPLPDGLNPEPEGYVRPIQKEDAFEDSVEPKEISQPGPAINKKKVQKELSPARVKSAVQSLILDALADGGKDEEAVKAFIDASGMAVNPKLVDSFLEALLNACEIAQTGDGNYHRLDKEGV
jgi:hypothetical protein